jgi:hypothetical protein
VFLSDGSLLLFGMGLHFTSQQSGPGSKALSFAWQIALNLSEAVVFSGLEKFDILGDFTLLSLEKSFIERATQQWMYTVHSLPIP